VDALIECLPLLDSKYEINTPLRLSHFLAQCAHESGGFRVTEENLNYKAEGLLKLFLKYFRNVDVNDYEHNPEKIANRIYANRMGNGDEASGDGYKFRGHGLIQLTGKTNYSSMAEELGVSTDDAALYLQTPEGAVESAGWFWKNAKINSKADEDDVLAVTKKVNGGTIGLEEREEYTSMFKEILGA
jgi:putative chitinase